MGSRPPLDWLARNRLLIQITSAAIALVLIITGAIRGISDTMGVILLSAGTSILASTIISSFDLLLGSGNATWLESQQEELVDKLVQRSQLAQSMQESGLLALRGVFTTQDLKDGIRNSRKRVWLLDNWICEEINDLQDVLIQANRRGVSIRILYMYSV